MVVVVPEGRRRRFPSGSPLLTGLLAAAILLVALYLGAVPDTEAGNDETSRTASAPLDERREMNFELATVPGSAVVRSADLGDRLYLVTTPARGKSLPAVVPDGAGLQLHLTPSGREGADSVDIQLNSKVQWRVKLPGGAADYKVDVRAGPVAGVEVTGKTTRVELTLPVPTATVPIRMSGGAGQFLVHVPGSVATRVRLGGGADRVNLDAMAKTAVPAETVYTPSAWANAKARYDIDLTAAVSTLRLDRT